MTGRHVSQSCGPPCFPGVGVSCCPSWVLALGLSYTVAVRKCRGGQPRVLFALAHWVPLSPVRRQRWNEQVQESGGWDGGGAAPKPSRCASVSPSFRRVAMLTPDCPKASSCNGLLPTSPGLYLKFWIKSKGPARMASCEPPQTYPEQGAR